MTKGHRLKVRCSVCGKATSVLWQIALITKIRVAYSCGHQADVDKIEEFDENLQIQAMDGSTPFSYQLDRIRRVEENNGRFIHGDEMGVGKMIMCILFLRLHKEAFPALVVCKARNRIQWLRQLMIWGGHTDFGDDILKPDIIPRIIEKPGHAPDFKQGKVYIISWDGLRTAPWIEDKRPEIKTVFLDEFQMMKNSEAGRTKAALLLCDGIPYLQGASGTPVKNHAGEFWPILHLFRPDKFPSQEAFDRDWVAIESKTKGGIKKNKKDEFDAILKPFYERLEVDDVLPHLPKIFRRFDFLDLDEVYKGAYEREQQKFQEAYREYEASGKSFKSWGAVSDSLFKLRHIVGIAKVDAVVDEIENFLDSSDKKLAVYHHHIDVGQLYYVHIARLCKERGLPPPIHVTGAMNDTQFDQAITEFTEGETRVAILRILAEGEGLNLQACGDVFMTERQFNPANEEQVERRFPREGTKHPKVNVWYPVAIQTVDELFTEMVEDKRRFCRATYGKDSDIAWDEGSTMKSLAALLAAKGVQSWKTRNSSKKKKPVGAVTTGTQLRLIK